MNAPATAAAVTRPPFIPGRFDDMPAETYHAIECLSAGGAKKILKTPAHFRLMRDKPNEPTASMVFGTVVHTLVLQPDLADSMVIAVPDDAPKRPTSAQRNAKKPSFEALSAIEFWDGFNERAAGKIILSGEDFDRARRTADAVHAHPAARALLNGALREISLFWEDADTGVPVKCRYDIWNREIGGDLKTCQSAHPDDFAKDIAKFLYHLQGALYWSGAEHRLATPDGFVFIAAESDQPHFVAVYELDQPSLLAGGALYREAMKRYAECVKAGAWPAYPDGVTRINVPGWALKSAFQQ